MRRLGIGVKAMLILGLTLHMHRRFHGPPIDYASIAAAAFASWVGIPGPGEPVLIAAGVFAAKRHLDIASVLVVAWAGAMAGGLVGWLFGLKAGRTVLTRRGPLHQMRLRTLARGDEIFARHPLVAIQLTPSWIAGIHGVRSALYLPVNACAAALWAVGIGLGAYYVGPTIVDVADDLGTISLIGLGTLIVIAVGGEVVRRRRRARPDRAAAEP
jgi:membrane protein DedA with SNARE-associated domain